MQIFILKDIGFCYVLAIVLSCYPLVLNFISLGRNPLYLGLIFVVFLLGQALWVQLDISGEFRNGAVSVQFCFYNLGSLSGTLVAWNCDLEIKLGLDICLTSMRYLF